MFFFVQLISFVNLPFNSPPSKIHERATGVGKVATFKVQLGTLTSRAYVYKYIFFLKSKSKMADKLEVDVVIIGDKFTVGFIL